MKEEGWTQSPAAGVDTLRDEYTRIIEPARALAAETLKLEDQRFVGAGPPLRVLCDEYTGSIAPARALYGLELWSVISPFQPPRVWDAHYLHYCGPRSGGGGAQLVRSDRSRGRL